MYVKFTYCRVLRTRPSTPNRRKEGGGVRGFFHISRAPPHNGQRRPQRYIYLLFGSHKTVTGIPSARGLSKALRKQHPKQTGLGQARACRAALVNHLLRFSYANLTVALKLRFYSFDCCWKKRQVAYYVIGHSKHIIFSAARPGTPFMPSGLTS